MDIGWERTWGTGTRRVWVSAAGACRRAGESYDGVGILDGNTFVVGWGKGIGVVVYHSTASGGLTGKSAVSQGMGSEILVRK